MRREYGKMYYLEFSTLGRRYQSPNQICPEISWVAKPVHYVCVRASDLEYQITLQESVSMGRQDFILLLRVIGVPPVQIFGRAFYAITQPVSDSQSQVSEF